MTQINAVEQASQAIKGIPYVEFTSGLIDGVFSTLIDSHTTQVQTFMELFSSISQGLESYINNTVDDIDDEETLEFLQNIPEVAEATLPAPLPEGATADTTVLEQLVGVFTSGNPAGTVNVATSTASTLLGALGANGVNLPAPLEELSSSLPTSTAETQELPTAAIFEAVAQRIAANRFGVLENMMQMGMMRLVVDRGELETSIKVKTFERHTDVVKDKTKDKEKLKKKTKTKMKTGLIFRLFGKAKRKNKVKSTQMHISKHSELHKDVSGSSVGIAARVKLEFSTDHMSLGG